MAAINDNVLSDLKQYWQDMTNFLTNVYKALVGLTGTVVQEIENILIELQALLSALLNAIEQFAIGEAQQIAQQIAQVVSQIQGLLNSAGISVG